MWTLPSLTLDTSIVECRDVSEISKNKMTNSVDPDEMAHLSCLIRIYIVYIRCLAWSTGLKEFIRNAA